MGLCTALLSQNSCSTINLVANSGHFSWKLDHMTTMHGRVTSASRHCCHPSAKLRDLYIKRAVTSFQFTFNGKWLEGRGGIRISYTVGKLLKRTELSTQNIQVS